MFSSGAKEARAEALRRGVLVEALGREVPIYHSHSSGFSHLERQECIRYSVARHASEPPTRWSFLQRDKVNGAQYENGWLFKSAEGQPAAGLEAVLIGIASEWTEEYLEFEADPTSVHAYWGEWGGAETAGVIINWLHALGGAPAAA